MNAAYKKKLEESKEKKVHFKDEEIDSMSEPEETPQQQIKKDDFFIPPTQETPEQKRLRQTKLMLEELKDQGDDEFEAELQPKVHAESNLIKEDDDGLTKKLKM